MLPTRNALSRGQQERAIWFLLKENNKFMFVWKYMTAYYRFNIIKMVCNVFQGSQIKYVFFTFSFIRESVHPSLSNPDSFLSLASDCPSWRFQSTSLRLAMSSHIALRLVQKKKKNTWLDSWEGFLRCLRSSCPDGWRRGELMTSARRITRTVVAHHCRYGKLGVIGVH